MRYVGLSDAGLKAKLEQLLAEEIDDSVMAKKRPTFVKPAETGEKVTAWPTFDNQITTANDMRGKTVPGLIVGKWLGMAELGFYSLAWNLMLVPIGRLLPVISKVAAPIFSKIQHSGAAATERAYHRAFMAGCLVGFPVFLTMSLICPWHRSGRSRAPCRPARAGFPRRDASSARISERVRASHQASPGTRA